jgi:hypothetical protein
VSQDLLKISPDALQLQLPSLSFGTLKDLYFRLYQHMRNKGDLINDQELINIQRKLSKIQGELNRRHKLSNEFAVWEKKLMHDLRRG